MRLAWLLQPRRPQAGRARRLAVRFGSASTTRPGAVSPRISCCSWPRNRTPSPTSSWNSKTSSLPARRTATRWIFWSASTPKWATPYRRPRSSRNSRGPHASSPWNGLDGLPMSIGCRTTTRATTGCSANWSTRIRTTNSEHVQNLVLNLLAHDSRRGKRRTLRGDRALACAAARAGRRARQRRVRGGHPVARRFRRRGHRGLPPGAGQAIPRTATTCC